MPPRSATTLESAEVGSSNELEARSHRKVRGSMPPLSATTMPPWPRGKAPGCNPEVPKGRRFDPCGRLQNSEWRHMDLDDFYGECAAILGFDHEGEAFTHYKRTRWNNRRAGRGRFPGSGLIRVFGNVVHISIREPVMVQRTIEGLPEALAYLRACVDNVGVSSNG